MQPFSGQSFEYLVLLYFILIKYSLNKMGAEESANLPQQSKFQHTPNTFKHNQTTISSLLQSNSSYKRKIKIFQKDDKPRAVTSYISAEQRNGHNYSRMCQKNVMYHQKTSQIYNIQSKITTSVPDFKERENLLITQRIKLRKHIKQDLQNYLLSDSPPPKKCTLNPQNNQEDKINSYQKIQSGKMTLQTFPKKSIYVSPNNTPNLLQTTYNQNNHFSSLYQSGINRKLNSHISRSPNEMLKALSSQNSPLIHQNNQMLEIKGALVSSINEPEQNMLKIEGPLRSRISQQQYEIVVNNINGEQKREFVNSIQKNNLLMWKIKERIQSTVFSEDEDGMCKIKGNLVSAVQTQDRSDQGMLKIKDRLVSAVQTEDELYRINDKLVSFAQK